MYICVCGDVTEDEIEGYLSQNKDAGVEEVASALGMAVGCEQCLTELSDIMNIIKSG